MQRHAVRSLLFSGNPQLQQAAALCLSQVPAALHTGCLPHLPGSTSSQPEQTPGVQQQQQHSTAGRLQDYHAAALAEQPQWHDRQQHQPQHDQLDAVQPHAQLQGSTAIHPPQGLQQRHAAAGQRAVPTITASGRHMPSVNNSTTSLASSPSSLQHSTSNAPTAAVDPSAAADVLGEVQQDSDYVFTLSSPEQQYRRTLAALHMGQNRNLDQLAHMLDPQAVLAAPDRGAAFLEAVMVAAAKLQDLQLLRQLLRCTAAAGNTLGSTGHRAVLQCLASCGRPVEALEWLQKRVPEQQLTPQLVRALVQPLLRHRNVHAAQQALDYAESKVLQQWQQGLHTSQPAAAGAADAAAAAQHGVQAASGLSSAEAGRDVPQTLQHAVQELFSLRLMAAGATGQVDAVQEQWAAIKAQAAALQQQQRQQEGAGQHSMQQDFLGVMVWAHYVLALSKTAGNRSGQRHLPQQDKAIQWLLDAVWQVFYKYHATAWSSYAAQQASAAVLQQGALQDAATLQHQQQWLAEQQQAAEQRWQHCMQSRGQLSWQQLDAAAVLPQEVATATRYQDWHFCKVAWQTAMDAASRLRDGQRVQQLLAVGSLLKLVPQEPDFEELLQHSVRQGAPPEALEELLGEMMSWGVIPTVGAYEAVMEAYAQHRDLAPAEAVLDRMQAAGHQPVLRSFNRLLNGVAVNGDLAAAIRVYNRLRLQGLQPDMQTMRALFKCVRMYATNVRVVTARSISQAKAGDRETIRTMLGQRAALFASAYSQLVLWQRDMVSAGLKHTSPSLKNLSYALERLGASEDCLQLARLAEEARPGDHTAHRAALKVVARTRDVHSAGQASKLLAQLASQPEPLTRDDYMSLISSQFWLKQDHEQLLQTVAAMKAAGHELDQHVLQQLLHVYCHFGMWGEALQVLNDVAAGRFSQPSGSSTQAVGATSGDGKIDSDQLWHVVLRKLWEKRAADELLNEFLKHMTASQLQRFKFMYGLQPIPGQEGRLTLRPLEDWQWPLQQQPKQQQQQQGQQQELQQHQQLPRPAGQEQQGQLEQLQRLEQLEELDSFGQSHPSLVNV